MEQGMMQTNLLGQRVRFRKEDHFPKNHSLINVVGHIRTVYLDSDGVPLYTIEIFGTGELVDGDDSGFRLENEAVEL